MDGGAPALVTDRMTVSYSPPRRCRRERRPASESIVLRHRSLALRLARRFARPGCSLERLERAACAALEKAARRYDARRSPGFTGFAIPAILAELRRNRPAPLARGLAEPLLRSADDAFLASRGRHPTAAETARLLGWPVEDAVEARLAASPKR